MFAIKMKETGARTPLTAPSNRTGRGEENGVQGDCLAVKETA